jgi:hypothetical protein
MTRYRYGSDLCPTRSDIRHRVGREDAPSITLLALDAFSLWTHWCRRHAPFRCFTPREDTYRATEARRSRSPPSCAPHAPNTPVHSYVVLVQQFAVVRILYEGCRFSEIPEMCRIVGKRRENGTHGPSSSHRCEWLTYRGHGQPTKSRSWTLRPSEDCSNAFRLASVPMFAAYQGS